MKKKKYFCKEACLQNAVPKGACHSLWCQQLWAIASSRRALEYQKDTINPICHLRTRLDFKRGSEIPSSGIDCKSQKLNHKTAALESDHKIQSKIITSPQPPKNSQGKTTVGKYLISEWANCAGKPYFITRLNAHDIRMETLSTEILNYLMLPESSPVPIR